MFFIKKYIELMVANLNLLGSMGDLFCFRQFSQYIYMLVLLRSFGLCGQSRPFRLRISNDPVRHYISPWAKSSIINEIGDLICSDGTNC